MTEEEQPSIVEEGSIVIKANAEEGGPENEILVCRGSHMKSKNAGSSPSRVGVSLSPPKTPLPLTKHNRSIDQD